VFSSLDGVPSQLQQWQGKLLLLNFWATWCVPCTKEIPELVKLQDRYGAQGLQIVGAAVDDPDAVKRALPKLKINYPLLGGSTDDLTADMEKLGNGFGALPFSVLISPQGRILDRHPGPFTAAELQALVAGRLPRK
jgi:thiol-disulfide isomerase/thioredoxin